MRVSLVTPPSETAISLEDAKLHLREQSSDYDVLIEAYIEAATDLIQQQTARCLITQVWRVTFDAFDDPFRLPWAPVQAVSNITYFDADNASQTLATSVYGTYADHQGFYLGLLNSQSWPAVYTRNDAISVTFVAGYGEPQDVPGALKAALMVLVGDMYANAESYTIGVSASSVPSSATADRLLSPYRRWSV